MQKLVSIKTIIGILVAVIIMQGCDTEDIDPADIIQTITILPQDVNFNSVRVGYNFQNLSESYKGDFGICYAIDSLATVEHGTISAEAFSGAMEINGLKSGTEYSIRPYVTTTDGIAYGPEIKQKTKGLAGTSWNMMLFDSRGRRETDLLLIDETSGEHIQDNVRKRVEYDILSDVYLEINIYHLIDKESLEPLTYKGRFIEEGSLHYTEGRPWTARLKTNP